VFVRASPLARRRAAQQARDLASLAGSGPEGAVVAADLRRPAERAPEAPPPAAPARRPARTRDRTVSMREATAALMARSKREIPHYYLSTTIDVGPSLEHLAELNAARSVSDRILPAALLVRATALAAREVPVINGHWEDGFRAAEHVHVGVAIARRDGGLIAPAIHDADALDLDDTMAALRDLVARARTDALRGSELTDATITVTNLGDQGVEEVFGVIYPPQVALVGFGKIVERPWAVEGMLGVRPIVRATLSADHRASYGHEGARFLAAIERRLRLAAL
jgi:pyruvate dehydrogenase E2 component (dihydrolipoamide acetyltransferase)